MSSSRFKILLLFCKVLATVADVKLFFDTLNDLGINFHPDDDFADFIDPATSHCCFSSADVATLNEGMQCCFDICQRNNCDIYAIALESFNKKHHTNV